MTEPSELPDAPQSEEITHLLHELDDRRQAEAVFAELEATLARISELIERMERERGL